VLQAVLAVLYGARRLLAEGVLPPALVHANPGYLRLGPMPAAPVLQYYAADLVRGPQGGWMVLADRTGAASGIAYARENRRLLSRVLPEMFRPLQVRQLRPFFDIWQDALRRLGPANGAGGGAVVLLTPGTRSRQWFEHVYLSRELSCGLVEGGDLTVRGAQVFLKTLKGLQPCRRARPDVGGARGQCVHCQRFGGRGVAGAGAGGVHAGTGPAAAGRGADAAGGAVPAARRGGVARTGGPGAVAVAAAPGAGRRAGGGDAGCAGAAGAGGLAAPDGRAALGLVGAGGGGRLGGAEPGWSGREWGGAEAAPGGSAGVPRLRWRALACHAGRAGRGAGRGRGGRG